MNRPFKTIRHFLLLLATAAAALCPGDAWADEVMYLDLNEYVATASATKITSTTTSISTNGNYEVYYFVEGDVTIDNLTITGSRNNDNVFIILCDDATLTITGQINCSCNLCFYAQSTGSHRGKVIATSAADDAIYGNYMVIGGGDVIVENGGIKAPDISLRNGHLTADRLIASIVIDIIVYGHSFSFKANEYIAPTLSVGFSIMADGETQIAKGTIHGDAGDSYSAYSAFKGKTLTVDPANLYNVTIDPAITGGTVTTNKAQAVAKEYVYVTFTPATGYMLTSASWTPEGGTTTYADATELATAQSTGKWPFKQYNKKDVTVSATFAPIAASITSGGTTTYYLTLADAFAATNEFETKTIVIQRDGIDESAETYNFNYDVKHFSIDLNGKTAKIGTISKYGRLTITDSSTGHTGKAEFAMVVNGGDVTIDGANVSMSWLENREPNFYELRLDNGATLTTDDAEWDSKTVLLDHGSHWTAKGWLDLGYADGFEFGINDRNSWVQLVDCSLHSFYAADHLRALLTPLAPIGTTININNAKDNNVVLRKTWSLDLRNAFNEISAGVPSATVQYFDGGTTAPTASTFDPSVYIPAGETGANEISEINNSDGKDHYIIMHIVPHESNPHDTEDPDYWTDERLLYVMEGASAASRSRGPGISLNLPYLLKADEYDAHLDPTDPDMQPRHDGAGWYYYKLPASHNVANGYTKSTLQGLAAPVFDMDAVSLAQDLETGVVTLSRTTDSWTAELTYDRLHWPFTGTIDDTDKPKLKKLVMKYGGTALITLDTTPASESASDVAKADAAQAEITAQIAHNYPFGQAKLEWNQQQIGSATAFGWFKRYSDDSYFWIDVPFTPLDPTEATYPAGTANNPWLIQNGAELSMLAKCVNIGYWTALERHLRQTADIDLTAEGVTDFEPIALTSMGGGFQGNYDGQGYSISHIDYTCTQLPDADGTKCYVGLFGQLFGMSDGKPGSVKNVTLKDCEFKADAGSCAVAVGTIAGAAAGMDANAFSVSGCKVLGSTVVSGPPADCYSGAIIGDWYSAAVAVENNYYGYNVSVTNAGGTATGYTPRGYTEGTYDDVSDTWSYEWKDVTANDGLVLGVKKATLPAATKSGSTVAFSQTTTPALADATHPADCYNISGTDYYYAVDQPVTLSVTTGSASPDGVRTFYDELETLTVTYVTTTPGTTTDVTNTDDVTATLSFAMPVADATVSATFSEADWFTIDTNQKEWMSFYHEWTMKDPTSGNDVDGHFVVSNYDDPNDPTKRVVVLTVTSVDPEAGTYTAEEINGSYRGVPTIFHYADDSGGTLPQKLKFAPDFNIEQNKTHDRLHFKGTAKELEFSADAKCYVLNNAGDFILAYITPTDNKIAANRCYMDLSGNKNNQARLVLNGDATGIDSMFNVQYSMFNSPWYSLDGRKLDGQPTQKGIYINGGRKVVIK